MAELFPKIPAVYLKVARAMFAQSPTREAAIALFALSVAVNPFIAFCPDPQARNAFLVKMKVSTEAVFCQA
jgi:hypothetical protein